MPEPRLVSPPLQNVGRQRRNKSLYATHGARPCWEGNGATTSPPASPGLNPAMQFLCALSDAPAGLQYVARTRSVRRIDTASVRVAEYETRPPQQFGTGSCVPVQESLRVLLRQLGADLDSPFLLFGGGSRWGRNGHRRFVGFCRRNGLAGLMGLGLDFA